MNINWKFWIGLVIAGLILYAVIRYPVSSAANVHVGLDKASSAADNLGTFLGNIFK
jgi:hypothetical protein